MSMRLGALDSLQRGLDNLRANWQLVLLAWLQTALTLVLSIVALLPFYFVLELELPNLQASPEELNGWTLGTLEHLARQLGEPAFWSACLSSSLLFVAALVCYSFFQAGSYGVLVLGDRRAVSAASPGGSPLPKPAAGRFQAFSWREFQARGGRHLWGYFWLYNLILLITLLWVLLAALIAAAAGLIAARAGVGAGLAIGCSAVLPMGFLIFLVAFWTLLAQVEISVRDSGAWRALRASLGILVRRLPAMALLFVLFGVATLGAGIVFVMISFPLNAGLSFLPALRRVLGLGLQAVQWLVNGAIQLALAATLVALYRSELARETEP